MTKVLKWLGGTLAAVLLLGVAGLAGADLASAESPPNPPARFTGTVLVDGVAPAAGTEIVAKVGDATCGVTAVFKHGADSRYVLDVPALDPGSTPNCGQDGLAVTFFVGGNKANETGSWRNYDVNILNLTVTTEEEEPGPPDTGNAGLAAASSNGSGSWMLVVMGLGALTLGAGSLTMARRSR
ncbi:MAG: hypothetical protein Kow0010_17320 [Dehalococcoidia bacterium]